MILWGFSISQNISANMTIWKEVSFIWKPDIILKDFEKRDKICSLKGLIGYKFQYKESLTGNKILYEVSDTKAKFSI